MVAYGKKAGQRLIPVSKPRLGATRGRLKITENY